jgi:hypothetical protein
MTSRQLGKAIRVASKPGNTILIVWYKSGHVFDVIEWKRNINNTITPYIFVINSINFTAKGCDSVEIEVKS